MSEPIGVGDWVECVDAAPRRPGENTLIVVGGVYLVTAIVGYFDNGVALAGLDPSPNFGWQIDRFRPIYRPNASLIEGLKTPIRERVTS